MPRVPPNPVFGVRTAATLGCPDCWRAANRVGGRWLMGAGVASVLAAPLPAPWPVGVMLIAVLAACVASLIATRRAPRDA
jgi:uncharacterized membrane protein